jgi:hypothetical protein
LETKSQSGHFFKFFASLQIVLENENSFQNFFIGCGEDDDCPHADEICQKTSNRCLKEPKCDFNNFPYETHDENSRKKTFTKNISNL